MTDTPERISTEFVQDAQRLIQEYRVLANQAATAHDFESAVQALTNAGGVMATLYNIRTAEHRVVQRHQHRPGGIDDPPDEEDDDDGLG